MENNAPTKKKRVQKKLIQALIHEFTTTTAAAQAEPITSTAAAAAGDVPPIASEGGSTVAPEESPLLKRYIASLEDPDDLQAFRIAQSHFGAAFFPEKTVGFCNWRRRQE